MTTRAYKDKLEELEIKLIMDFLRYSEESLNGFSEAEIDRALELLDRQEQKKLTTEEAEELAAIEARMGDYTGPCPATLVADPVRVFDRIEAAGIEI